MHTVYFSELCTATGDVLERHQWQKPSQLESPYLWPPIPKPTTGEWQTWQCTLQQTYSLGRNLALPLPLGKWHWTQLTQTGWFYSTTDKALYRYNGTEWSRHGQTPSRTRTKKFHITGQTTENSEALNLQAASILLHGSFYIMTRVAEIEPVPNKTVDT